MDNNPPIPVVILGGYLGSGKTTLINQCLQNGLQNAAIIVNDFGDINIDAALVSQYSSDTLELTNGCICCSIGESLAETFFTILDRPIRPEIIIVETSGVSNPSSVAAFTHMKGLTNAGILVLVDAMQALDTSSNSLLRKSFESQILSAHLLAITKSQDASVDQINNVQHLLSCLAPHTIVVEASTETLTQLINSPIDNTATTTQTNDESHRIQQRVHVFSQPIDEAALTEFVVHLESHVIRAKGIVELIDGSRRLVHKTGPHVSITPTTLQPTGIVLLSTQ